MCLLIILGLILVMVLGAALLALSVGGGLFIIVFADLIVCAVIIVALIKFLRNRKNKKK